MKSNPYDQIIEILRQRNQNYVSNSFSLNPNHNTMIPGLFIKNWNRYHECVVTQQLNYFNEYLDVLLLQMRIIHVLRQRSAKYITLHPMLNIEYALKSFLASRSDFSFSCLNIFIPYKMPQFIQDAVVIISYACIEYNISLTNQTQKMSTVLQLQNSNSNHEFKMLKSFIINSCYNS